MASTSQEVKELGGTDARLIRRAVNASITKHAVILLRVCGRDGLRPRPRRAFVSNAHATRCHEKHHRHCHEQNSLSHALEGVRLERLEATPQPPTGTVERTSHASAFVLGSVVVRCRKLKSTWRALPPLIFQRCPQLPMQSKMNISESSTACTM